MKKIVLLPLDERPCTYDYPAMLASMSNDINFVEIPREFMGDIKQAGNIVKMQEFLLKECIDADYAIIAIDSLLYGGIVPSRLHYDNEETLLKRLEILKQIKQANPSIKIYAYNLIMRCPSGDGDSEEPTYYGWCGEKIHQLGKFQHLKKIAPLSLKQQKEYDEVLEFFNKNDAMQYVDDYVNRRKINALMNIHTLNYAHDGTIDFLIIPQDDSAPYGFTAMDQMVVRKKIEELRLELKVLMYPDADAVSNSLLARTINEIHQLKPKVFIRYNTCNEGNIIPNYEDRPVSESIKYQILAAGGMVSYDFNNSDIVLMVNLPLANMAEARRLYDDLHKKENPGETDLNYTVGRNLVEYIEFIKYLNSIKKCVCVADIAYANGGDTNLFNLMKNEHLLFKVDAYAGWNTAANTLGTAIPLAMIHNIYSTSQEFLDFMGLRYLEDVGYMANVRFTAYDLYRDKYLWKQIDGKEDGEVATFIRKQLIAWANENLDDEEYKVTIIKHTQPWNRFFETGLIVKTIKK